MNTKYAFILLLFTTLLGYQNCGQPLPKDLQKTSSSENCIPESIQTSIPESPKKNVDVLFVTHSSLHLRQDETPITRSAIESFIWQLPNDVNYQISVLLAHGSLSPYAGQLYQSEMGEPAVLKSSEMHIQSNQCCP